jgi:hypothetical protein
MVVVVGVLLTRDRGDDGSAPLQAGASTPDQLGPTGRSFSDHGAQGEITEVDGSTLTLRSTRPGSSEAETVTVETDGDTTFTDLVDGSIGDLHTGDNVLVRGVDGDDDTDGRLAAASITDNGDQDPGAAVLGGPGGFRTEGGGPPDGAIVVPEGAAPPEGGPDGGTRMLARITAGTITEVDGDRITVETPEGDQVVVTTTSDTDVRVQEEIGLGDLEEGDDVRVVGERDGDVVTASSVRRGEDVEIFGDGPHRARSGADGSAS